MQQTIVALDLETTGLDAHKDAILEIGAIKFRGNEVLGTFETLVNPERNIPEVVQRLTGIKPADAAKAPRLADVLPQFIEFVGDADVLGHSVRFDLGFLEANGFKSGGHVIDTYELASALLPSAGRYNLLALTQMLNVVAEGDYHRALTDSIATMQLYNVLWERLTNDVPHAVVQEVVRAAKGLGWLGEAPFVWAASDQPSAISRQQSAKSDQPPATSFQPQSQLPIADDAASQAISEALEIGGAVLLEIPAAVERMAGLLRAASEYALKHGEQVGIATFDLYTNEHQRTLYEAAREQGTNAVIMKARADYLCPRRLETLRRRPPTSIEELRVLAKILVWGEQALTGDRDGISLRGPAEAQAWYRLSAADEGCALDRCETQTGGACPFYKACKAAQAAPLVLIDQGLLFADTAGIAPILPPLDRLIIEDGHHLEESATAALGKRLELPELGRLFADFGSLGGGLFADLFAVIDPALSDKQRDNTRGYLDVLSQSVRAMNKHTASLFEAFANVLKEEGPAKSDYLTQLRLTPALRDRASFVGVRAAWSVLAEFMSDVSSALGKLADRMIALRDRLNDPAFPDVVAAAHAGAAHLHAAQTLLAEFIETPAPNTLYWLEMGGEQSIPTLRAAPLQIGPHAAKAIWNRRSAVLVSSTLQAGNGFEYIKEQLGAPPLLTERTVANPADTKKTLLYLPNDLPEPNERDAYQKAIDRALIELAAALDGRTLALFTGSGQVRQTAGDIEARLELSKIAVLDGADGSGRKALSDSFNASSRAVLLGGKAYWEEAELDPDALAALVLTRLPFGAPGEPLTAARGELYKESFNQFSVPDAILKFRQGFDRLTRARVGRRGVAVVMDKRLTSKGYGTAFLESLPPCEVVRGPLADLAKTAKAWVGTD